MKLMIGVIMELYFRIYFQEYKFIVFLCMETHRIKSKFHKYLGKEKVDLLINKR